MFRLLLVDDERIIVDSLYAYLGDHFQAEIHRAYSAFEAMGILRRIRFDIVITDISMPGMDGLELLSFIKQHWPACNVIMLTGYDDFSYAYQAYRFKGTDFILKIEPFETIRKAVADRLEALTRERNQAEHLIALGDRLTQLLPMIRHDLVSRVLRYGDELPDSENLARIGLLLDPGLPVLLAVGEVGPAQGTAPFQASPQLSAMVERRMRERGLRCTVHQHQPEIVWLIQKSAQAPTEPEEDLAEYAREIFFEAPEWSVGEIETRVRLAVCQHFIDWRDLPAYYSAARAHIQNIGDSGVSVVLPMQSQRDVPMERSPLSAVEQLAALYRQGDQEAFMQQVSLLIAPLRQTEDFASIHPSPVLAALCVLTSEALRSLGIFGWPDQSFTQVLSGVGYTDGAQWCGDALRLVDGLFILRKTEQERQRQQLVNEIHDYMDRHYREDISLSLLARHVHYNPSYLSRIYSEITGNKLMNYLTEVRIAHAKALLTDTDKKIEDIARQCGFFSARYFIQVFKKKTQVTPVAYRQGTL